jgi:hypothetical protein
VEGAPAAGARPLGDPLRMPGAVLDQGAEAFIVQHGGILSKVERGL